MNSPKFISYRRWRKKLTVKELFKKWPVQVMSFRPMAARKTWSWNEVRCLNPQQDPIKLLAYYYQWDENQTRELCQRLLAEHAKLRLFRAQRVAEIKNLIKKGNYSVSGKDVVDQWFPKESAPGTM